MLLAANEERESVEVHRSFDAPETQSTGEMHPMERLEGRKRSPQVKDLMLPRTHFRSFPAASRKPSLRKSEISRNSKFGLLSNIRVK